MYAYDRTILGYHGCDANVAKELLAGKPFKPSENRYDWLGSGVYFWEFGPNRALRFAELQIHRGRVRHPAVVGAVIQLGNCFDLLDTEPTEALAIWYPLWRKSIRTEGKALPQNEGGPPYRMLRFRDCAVINSYCSMGQKAGEPSYDTVRGCFLEGSPLYPGSGMYRQTHIQVAVRNPACILGVFRPTIKKS